MKGIPNSYGLKKEITPPPLPMHLEMRKTKINRQTNKIAWLRFKLVLKRKLEH